MIIISRCREKTLANKKYSCYFDLSLKVISGKWKCAIIYHLMLQEQLKYSDLQKTLIDISDRMLTKQLKELEHDQIISRIDESNVYSLTWLGLQLARVFKELRDWGILYEEELGTENYDPQFYEPKDPPMRFKDLVSNMQN